MSDRLARPAITAKTDYLGLSWLKFIAALLVIANHTGPFAVFGSSADFLVDGALTRIAVPIFFMTSGFFYFRKLTGDPLADRRHLRRYLGSIAKLYAIAILLYVPLNVYNGYFSSPKFGILSLLRDLAFDGTFYHLWYLPALMIGIAMLHGLYRALKPASVMIVACLLYAVGLFGDSYYGLIAGSGVLTGWYNGMFHVFDYTRNGLFFAPVYLALGAFVARSEKCRSSRPAAHAALFLVSLSAMLAEALWLREGGIPRHDSMYIFAVPAAYFLLLLALPLQRTGEPYAAGGPGVDLRAASARHRARTRRRQSNGTAAIVYRQQPRSLRRRLLAVGRFGSRRRPPPFPANDSDRLASSRQRSRVGIDPALALARDCRVTFLPLPITARL
ncbi:acyltransferase family protein [Cohnella rhizosphaerae]|uniref:Acyltransferase n=1 Tax=Cohnella rhizosphaerae TaxID=1457232 RepID=A0A9X4QWB1_9BACL|nr:acyltransferase [Cohnella rhizosphaerae]MDG0814271.1 acyltransferase [Cohnella rhizosphaerae]